MSADEKTLGSMHDRMAVVMKDILDNGETAMNKEGEKVTGLTPSASTLNVIRQFLKDNGIDTARRKASPVASLAESLPTFEPDAEEDDGEGRAVH